MVAETKVEEFLADLEEPDDNFTEPGLTVNEDFRLLIFLGILLSSISMFCTQQAKKVDAQVK
jgi:hypothetical protein